MQRILPLVVLSAVLAGCSETSHPTAPEEIAAPLFSSAPVREQIRLMPIATCADDIGFNIGFVIDAEQLRHTNVDGQGKRHTTRHFRAKGFEAWMLTRAQSTRAGFAQVRDMRAPDYVVQGGAEMFSVQTTGTGAVIEIHQGNLVFENQTTGQRVIAHHTIRDVPGQERVSFWNCRVVG